MKYYLLALSALLGCAGANTLKTETNDPLSGICPDREKNAWIKYLNGEAEKGNHSALASLAEAYLKRGEEIELERYLNDDRSPTRCQRAYQSFWCAEKYAYLARQNDESRKADRLEERASFLARRQREKCLEW